MKKLGYLLLGAIFSASCEKMYNSKVLVFRKSSDLLSTARRGTIGLLTYDAVAPSGDTIKVDVPENIARNTKLPYNAFMVKNKGAAYGEIRYVMN